MTAPGTSAQRQWVRQERSRQAVAAAVAVARRHGLGVEQPAVLNDLFSVMVHLRPAPVVARVPTWVSRLRVPVGDWLDREIAVTTYLSDQGLPVVTPSQELPPGPHHHDGFAISFWTYLEPDPELLARCTELRALQVALCLAGLYDVFGDLEGWDEGIRSMLGLLGAVP
jgi:hypothetical protein